ncbi:MAG: CPBP family intramembrane glutamic endopeptidase [Rhizomicrobium sp.]
MPQLTILDWLVVAYFALVMPVQSWHAGRYLAATPRSAIDMTARYRVIIVRDILLAALILFDWNWTGRPWFALGFDIPVGLAGRIGFGFDALLLAWFTWTLTLKKMSAEARATADAQLTANRIAPETPAEFRLFPVVGVVGSAFEELLFRGFAIWFLAPFVGLWGAVIVSSACFGLNHIYQGWLGVVRTGLFGLAFGTAYALSHSLWWLMLAHVMFNVYGGLLARKLRREMKAT